MVWASSLRGHASPSDAELPGRWPRLPGEPEEPHRHLLRRNDGRRHALRYVQGQLPAPRAERGLHDIRLDPRRIRHVPLRPGAGVSVLREVPHRPHLLLPRRIDEHRDALRHDQGLLQVIRTIADATADQLTMSTAHYFVTLP